MPDGGKIHITTQNTKLNEEKIKTLPGLNVGDYVKITVKDNGIGIPSNLKDKVFEPFFSTKGPDKGTGLGLATTYAIVKNLKGLITFESDENVGTTFTILLPVSKKTLSKSKKDSPLVKGKGTILIIDDDLIILELVARQLSYLGYKTMIAQGGKEGIKIYKSKIKTIDLIILDIVMPQMDGHETFLKLKSLDPGVKVIAASGYSKERKAESLLKAGVLEFIQKPFRLAELSKLIDSILRGKK
jgi:CheY-like chemotaxis protein